MVFITGTDTGCGKTHVSCALLRQLAAIGVPAAGMKPVATGATQHAGVRLNEDAELLRVASPVRMPPWAQNPYLFALPASPHISARREGAEISPGRIKAAFRESQHHAAVVVVEGVGGWCVPIAAGYSVAELVRDLSIPVVLVVGLKLGCINHALLTAGALAVQEAPVLGWVANEVDPGLEAVEEVLETLDELLPFERLGYCRWQDQADLERLCSILTSSQESG